MQLIVSWRDPTTGMYMVTANGKEGVFLDESLYGKCAFPTPKQNEFWQSLLDRWRLGQGLCALSEFQSSKKPCTVCPITSLHPAYY